MLIDEQMPTYDFVERHDRLVRATPAATWAALYELDFAKSPLAKLLLMLRGFPGGTLTLGRMQEFGFVQLAARQEEEIVLGAIGQFWRPTGGLRRTAPEKFRDFAEPGFAKVAWNFSLHPEDGATRLRTETRIACIDAHARRRFGWYWLLVRRFSGFTRTEALRMIKNAAEKGGE